MVTYVACRKLLNKMMEKMSVCSHTINPRQRPESLMFFTDMVKGAYQRLKGRVGVIL